MWRIVTEGPRGGRDCDPVMGPSPFLKLVLDLGQTVLIVFTLVLKDTELWTKRL